MDGADWLRTELTSFGCGSCGRAYQPGRIRILAQREDLFFVDLACETCGSQAVAVVTIQTDDAGARADAGEIQPVQLLERDDASSEPAGPPVSPDEVLEMHEFLSQFDGDFEALFRPRRREA